MKVFDEYLMGNTSAVTDRPNCLRLFRACAHVNCLRSFMYVSFQRMVLHMLYTTKMATTNKGQMAVTANGDRVLHKMVTQLLCPVNMNRPNNRLNRHPSRRLHRLCHHHTRITIIRYKVCNVMVVLTQMSLSLNVSNRFREWWWRRNATRRRCCRI